MKLFVCVGSSCHLKGSHDVIKRLQELIKEYHVYYDIELAASFCLGHCAEGVAMMVNDELILNANKDTIDDIFINQILPRVRKE